MNHRIRQLLVCISFILLAIGIGACTSALAWRWQITCEHNLDSVRGKTFTVVPLRNEVSELPDFTKFAKLAAEHLSQHGMIYLDQAVSAKADFIVSLDFGIGRPRTTDTASGAYYLNRNSQTGGASAPRTNTPGSTNNTFGNMSVMGGVHVSSKVYPQFVRIVIFDAVKVDGKPVKRYESKAEDIGTVTDLTQIVPRGIEALLQNFPGEQRTAKD